MRFSKTILSLFLFCGSLASASELYIDETIYTKATPLQAYNALCVDWQLLQWTGAKSAFCDVREGGVWSLNFVDKYSDMNSGVYKKFDPGIELIYDFNVQETPTFVSFRFQRSGDSTKIHIEQSQGGASLQNKCEAYWNDMLPRLLKYLDNIAGSYIAYPIGNGPFPAVILLHDRFGLNRTTRALADSLAAKGYLALCVDMFKGDVTGGAVQASRFLSLVNDVESSNTIQKAHSYLKSLSDVTSRKIAVWGVGYGGSMAMRMITAEPSLKACVDWYGNKLPSTDELSRISTPILCIFASRDAASPSPVISAFNQELVQAGVKADLVIIAGNEGFADPANAENYNAESLREAWERTLLFLDRKLRL